MRTNNPFIRSLVYMLFIVVGVLIYAYGWKVTDINLQEPQEERRQQQVVRALRGLLRPDLIERDEESMDALANFMVPCGLEPPEAPVADGPQSIVVTPACGVKGDQVTVEGFDFRAGSKGYIYWITPEGNERPVASVRSDSEGYFSATFTVPSAPESDAPYQIRGRIVWPVGAHV